MICHHPHCLTGVLRHGYSIRSEETRLHVEQGLLFRLHVVDDHTRWRTLPDQSAAVHDGLRRGGRDCDGLAVVICGERAIDDLEVAWVDKGIIFRVSQYDPAVRTRRDTVRPYGLQCRVVCREGPLRTSIFVDAHSTTTQHSYPDVAPLILSDAPDIVRHQRAAWVRRTIILPLAVLVAQDTALIRTEPQAAVLCGVAAHDDVAGHTETVLRELFHRLQCLRVHLNDTAVVAPNPVVAILVFRDGVDVADGHALKVRHRLKAHGHTVLIAGEPHTAQLVEVQMFDGIVRQRGLVALHA